MTFHAAARVLLVAACLAVPALGGAQRVRADSNGSKTFFTRRDLAYSAVAIAGSLAISHFDVRIAHWNHTSRVQGDSNRTEVIESLTKINELPLTLAAIGTYGLGRLSHSNTITDVGLHTAEALVLTIGVSELIRVPVGRRRPRASPGEQYKYTFGGGFSNFDDRSFPSLHASSAFATASALSGEIGLRNPAAARFVTPVLYTAALVPGLTRLYLDQHWASDVAPGAFVGTLLGSRVVRYAHSHDRNWMNRMLMGASVVPNAWGGMVVMTSFTH